MSSAITYVEFDAIDLAIATKTGPLGEVLVDATWRQAYTRQALEPALHQLIKSAAKQCPGAKVRIAMAVSIVP